MKKYWIVWLLLLATLLVSCSGIPGAGVGTTGSIQNTVLELPTTEPPVTDPPVTPDPPIPEDPGMISHWSFDTIGENGLVEDASGRKNGTAINCEVVQDGLAGNSLLLQPSYASQVSFGTSISNALAQTGAITLSFWYYPMTAMLQESTLFQLTMEDGKAGVRISARGSTYTVGVRNNDKNREQTKTYSCSGWGEWMHLSLVVDFQSQEVRLYRNGAEIKAAEGSKLSFRQKSYDPGTPKYDDVLGGVGYDRYAVRFFSGKLDEVYLFSRAASATEIKALYGELDSLETPAAKESLLYAKLGIYTSTGNVILHKDSNVVLYNADRCCLVPGDASHKVILENGSYYAPLAFYEAYCGKRFTEPELSGKTLLQRDGEQYLSVSDYAAMTGDGVKLTEEGTVIIGGKANSAESAVLAFVERYYAGELDLLPVPEDDFYSSRAEVAVSNPASGVSLASPSIVRLSDGTLLASFDYNGKKYSATGGGTNDSAVCRSTDNGKTWSQPVKIPRMMWGTLFSLEDVVYLVGKDTATGKLAIVKSTDGGNSWTSAADGQIDRTVYQAHRAPTPAVVHNGRIYIAVEDSANDNGQMSDTPTKRAFMMSAPVDADLLSAASWTKSNNVSFDKNWVDPSLYYGGSYTGFGFYEGNAVAGPDGSMYIISRLDSDPTAGLAIVLKLSADNKTLTFERTINLPVGKDKFVIRYDEVSGKYIAIGNAKQGGSYPTQRNILAMYWSTDLITWNYAATLISDNSLIQPEFATAYYGYQYPDFLIVGNDILMVVREASGTTTYFHDANYITYYEVNDFRRFLN